jgi:hypothetical protein
VDFRDAYRSLPEYQDFTVIDANVPAPELQALLEHLTRTKKPAGTEASL